MGGPGPGPRALAADPEEGGYLVRVRTRGGRQAAFGLFVKSWDPKRARFSPVAVVTSDDTFTARHTSKFTELTNQREIRTLKWSYIEFPAQSGGSWSHRPPEPGRIRLHLLHAPVQESSRRQKDGCSVV